MHTPTMYCAGCGGSRSLVVRAVVGGGEPRMANPLPGAVPHEPAYFMGLLALDFSEIGMRDAA